MALSPPETKGTPDVGPPGWGSKSHRLDTPMGRFKAWASMFFVDHGFFRYAYLNLWRIDAQAYRSAQPGPRHIRRVARLGVKTIVNLRGGREFGSYPLEREACAREGLAYEEIRLWSRQAPPLETLEALEELLDRIEYPALFHCKSGADRAGVMSALYLVLRGAPATEAKRQLSLKFGHVRQSKTGVLDVFIERFAQAQEEAAARGETLSFMDWARRDYDFRALNKEVKTKAWANWLVDGLLDRE
ncbi:MAG: tyrosine-protein phosphatase [Pseudomonadota bacterium]